MKRFILWFCMHTKRQFKNAVFLLLFLLIPFTTFVASKLAVLWEKDTVTVAVCGEGPVVDELLLMESVYDFYLCEDTELMRASVKSGLDECGYIFENDRITVVCEEDSVIAEAVSETVFSVYFKYYVANKLHSYGDASAVEKYFSYLDGNKYEVDFVLPDGEVYVANPKVFPLKPMLLVMVMLGGIFGAILRKNDRERGVFLNLSMAFKNLLLVVYIGVPVVSLLVCTFVSLIIFEFV